MTLDRLDTMRTFIEIVEAGSFSAAASRLGVSVPAVSRRLGGFEARVGARLLSRTTRRVSLTECGRRYYDNAKRILADVAVAEAELGEQHSDSHPLRIAVSDLFGRNFVAPALPGFLDRYPLARVELAFTPDRVVVEWDADALITLGDKSNVQGLPARRLGSFRYVACAAPRYLRRAGVPTCPDDLLGHDCVRIAQCDGANAGWLLSCDGREFRLTVDGRLCCNDTEAAIEAVLAGAGIAQIPSFCVRDLVRKGRVRVVLKEFEPRAAAVYLLTPQPVSNSLILSAFVEYLAATINDDRLGV